jgi:surfeit locus 1 family protein
MGTMWQRLRQARLFGVTAFGLLLLAGLIGLGIWQLERLAWKEALLGRLARRVGTAPVALSIVERQWRADGDLEYLHAAARGRFHHDKERYLYAPQPGGLGWHVYTPLEFAPGRILWVNRGWVDEAHKRAEERAPGQSSGETEVKGLIRLTASPGLFTPHNDAARNLWYWPDLAHMTGSAFPAPTPETLPFRLEVDASPLPPGGLPRGGVTRLDLPNRHLQYAVTWFALALALIAVYFAFARHRLRLGGAKNADETPSGPQA